MDAAALLKIMAYSWNEVFRNTLDRAGRSLVHELLDVRNAWAHQRAFSTDDAYRALDSAYRLLTLVSSPQASEVKKMRDGLHRPSVTPHEPPKPPAQNGQSFWVYTDEPTNVSRIHQHSCRYYQNRSSTRRSNNWWHGPYTSGEQARSSPENRGEVRECGTCRPCD